jgi:hypothetical protein
MVPALACVAPTNPPPRTHHPPTHPPPRYGYDWPRIWAELLPTKSLAQLKNRRKNRCAGNAPDNCIKVRRRQGGPGAFRSGGGGACCLQARSSSR